MNSSGVKHASPSLGELGIAWRTGTLPSRDYLGMLGASSIVAQVAANRELTDFLGPEVNSEDQKHLFEMGDVLVTSIVAWFSSPFPIADYPRERHQIQDALDTLHAYQVELIHLLLGCQITAEQEMSDRAALLTNVLSQFYVE